VRAARAAKNPASKQHLEIVERTDTGALSFLSKMVTMPWIIDSHEDLAYNALNFQRDYLKSADEIRQAEKDGPVPQTNGQTLLGWSEYQRGQVAMIFGTLFLAPRRYATGAWETQAYSDAHQAFTLYERQISYYRRLTDEHPDQFRLVLTRKDLREVITPWEKAPAHLPRPVPPTNESEPGEQEPPPTVTHPVGIVLLLEGAEGIRSPEDMEHWWERGVRLAGPVWAGTRFCGGTMEPGDFSREGYALLDIMGSLGYTLDISHMNEASALQALDRYAGPIIASHANARSRIKDSEGERQLTDLTIRRLIERDGIIGVIPYNRFLLRGWKDTDNRQEVTLRTLISHIDHICQLAGDARHVGIGTDFDGGFGWPAVPYEINTIADLQKLAPLLEEYGYSQTSIAGILGENWRSHLERTLPQS
jgi:membrane dipeptidase